ncbi:hypothetical protein WJX84_009719 [Apatococcus fuscideae]
MHIGNIMRFDQAPLLAMAASPNRGLLLQSHSGDVHWLSSQPDAGLIPLASLPRPCPVLLAAPVAFGSEESPAAIGLAPSGQLFWGEALLATDATSVTVRRSGAGGAFLLYTTRTHFLYTIPFRDLGRTLLGPAANVSNKPLRKQGMGHARQENVYSQMHAAMKPALQAQEASARRIEQGGLLVAAPPGSHTAILQMPRGNLEVVCPRPLVVAAIAHALQGKEYGSAWELAVDNRVDLNLLVDFCWPAFLGNAAAFVQQVPGDQDQADLLAALRPGSTAAPGGLYGSLLSTAEPLEPKDGMPVEGVTASSSQAVPGDKVEVVSTAIREALQAASSDAYLRPIVTSHAINGDLEGALAAIKAAKEAQLQTSGTAPGLANGHVQEGEDEDIAAGMPTAEDGMRHLLLVTDFEKLYRAALGMYDLELAFMVVAHSQRDPGEYLLELQQWAAVLQAPLRQHALNMHLHRFSHALRNLVNAGPDHFQRAIDLARDKGLLRELMKLVEGDPDQWRATAEAHAGTLSQRSMHEDAAVAFLAAKLPEQALASYQSGGHWQMAFALAGRLKWDEGRMHRMAEDMVAGLSSMGQSAEAAAVALQHLQDVDGAVSLLAQARQWRSALHTAYRHRRSDLLDTVIGPAAAEAASTGLSDFRESLERVDKYLTRYKHVRQQRAALEAAMADEAEAGPEALPDDATDVDDAASMVSGLSAYAASTAATSTAASTGRPASTVGGRKPQRNRQKANKRMKIKQGSPHEQVALAHHITSLAMSAEDCASIGQLTELLILLGHQQDAQLLQQRLSQLMAEQSEAAAWVAANPPSGQETQPSANAQPAPVASGSQASQTSRGNVGGWARARRVLWINVCFDQEIADNGGTEMHEGMDSTLETSGLLEPLRAWCLPRLDLWTLATLGLVSRATHLLVDGEMGLKWQEAALQENLIPPALICSNQRDASSIQHALQAHAQTVAAIKAGSVLQHTCVACPAHTIPPTWAPCTERGSSCLLLTLPSPTSLPYPPAHGNFPETPQAECASLVVDAARGTIHPLFLDTRPESRGLVPITALWLDGTSVLQESLQARRCSAQLVLNGHLLVSQATPYHLDVFRAHGLVHLYTFALESCRDVSASGWGSFVQDPAQDPATNPPPFIHSFVVSPNGKLVAMVIINYAAGSLRGRPVVIVDLQTSQALHFVWLRWLEKAAKIVWSPCSTHIALTDPFRMNGFARLVPGGQWDNQGDRPVQLDLAACNAVTGKVWPLVVHDGRCALTSIAWAPHGLLVASFWSLGGGGFGHRVRVDTMTGEMLFDCCFIPPPICLNQPGFVKSDIWGLAWASLRRSGEAVQALHVQGAGLVLSFHRQLLRQPNRVLTSLCESPSRGEARESDPSTNAFGSDVAAGSHDAAGGGGQAHPHRSAQQWPAADDSSAQQNAPAAGNVPLKMASCGRGEVPGQNLPWVHEVTVQHVPGASFAAMAPGGRMLVMFSEYCPASYAPAGSSVVRGKLRYGPKAKPGRSKRTGVCNLLHHDLPSGQRHVVAGGFPPQPRTMHEPAWLPFSWATPIYACSIDASVLVVDAKEHGILMCWGPEGPASLASKPFLSPADHAGDEELRKLSWAPDSGRLAITGTSSVEVVAF